MTKLNRTIQPTPIPFQQRQLPCAQTHHLNNGIEVTMLNGGQDNICRIELIFPAGTWQQPNPFIAYTTSKLLDEGTQEHDAAWMAEALDYFGSYFDTSISRDSAGVTLYSLNTHVNETLPLIEEIVKRPAFDARELETFLNNEISQLKIREQKVDYICRTRFPGLLFGYQHPYGRKPEAQHLESITREQLIAFHQNHYNSQNCRILAAGRLPDNILEILNHHFGNNDWNKGAITETKPILTPNPGCHYIEKPDAIQSAIRIGRQAPNRYHPDYHLLNITTSILGGYFGSRLMSNLREDKGFTYGIHSSVMPMVHDGMLFIATEVKAEITDRALHEIYFELERLTTDPVPINELNKVKQYLQGEYLRSIDGTMAVAERYRGLMEYNISQDHFQKYLNTLQNITPEQVMDTAQKYLNKKSMTELVVGKK